MPFLNLEWTSNRIQFFGEVDLFSVLSGLLYRNEWSSISGILNNAPIPKKYNYKNIISTHKKTYEYLYDLVEMIEEPFHIQFSDSDIASLITIIKEI